MKRETEEDRAKRQSLYEAYKVMGGTLTGFARSQGMTYWKAQYAITKCRREQLDSSGESLSAGGSRSERLFREIKAEVIPERMCDYTVVLKSGRSLKIPENFSPERLQLLVEVLEG